MAGESQFGGGRGKGRGSSEMDGMESKRRKMAGKGWRRFLRREVGGGTMIWWWRRRRLRDGGARR